MTAPAPEFTSTVAIDLGERRYDILIGSGLFDAPSSWGGLPRASVAMIVTNDVVAPLYLSSLERQLAPHYDRIESIVLPDGEPHKNWASLDVVIDQLLAGAADR